MSEGSRTMGLERDLPRALRLFLLAVVVLTAVNVVVELICKFGLGLRYPYTWPFVAPVSRFNDLVDWMPRFARFGSAAFFHQLPHVLYTAPGCVVFWLFSLTGRSALAVYLSLAGVIAISSLWLFGRSLRRAGLSASATGILLATLLLTSYPFWFLIHTANIELVLWLFTMLGVWAFARERFGWAATCFGIAAAMKIYPLAYLLLFFGSRPSREWLRGLQGVVTGAVVTLACLWTMSPDLARSWNYVRQGNEIFLRQDGLGYRRGVIGFDHTLWGLLKAILPETTPEHRAPLLAVYLGLVAVFVVGAWVVRVRSLPLVNRVLFVTLVSIWLTPTSYDYTLVHMYASFALLVLAIMERRGADGVQSVALGCFSVVLTAQGYFILSGDHFAAQIKCFCLLMLMAVAVSLPLRRQDMSQYD